jgi:cytochrome c peroxidase
MRERVLVVLACALMLGFATAAHSASPNSKPTPAPTAYDPYPSGILPQDLDSEIARVQGEIQGIENEAIGEWEALPPLMPVGNPPIFKGSGYQAVEVLGKLMNFDLNISPFKNTACASCHMPYAAFSGPIPSVNLTMIAYPGSFHYRAAKRTAQRYTYSADFPVLEYNSTQDAFFGGNFWDGRATGYMLLNPAANQAQGPPVDPLEQGFPDTACIAFRLSTAVYVTLFEEVWGDQFTIKWPKNTEQICDTPGEAAIFGGSTTPVPLSPADRAKANNIYDHWGQSLAKYETSNRISPFTSKFDASLASPPAYTLTADEMAGYQLFNGKGNCNSCHLDGVSTNLSPSQSDTGTNNQTRPLFTCFGYTNVGLPLNPRIALFYETTPDFFGFNPNPDGFGYRDLGIGTFLRSGPQSWANPNSAWVPLAPTWDGRFQTLTARNVALTPPQCPTTEAGQVDSKGNPIPYFQKEFFHNGYIKSLKQLVHFYNTRDAFPLSSPVTSGHCPSGTTERVNCWPEPEVLNNEDMTVGKLGLTDTEENQIVAFLQTLTDGFTTPYPDVNTFTGTCQTGGDASTQGNETLIPAPEPLPPCASDVCGVAPTPFPSPGIP